MPLDQGGAFEAGEIRTRHAFGGTLLLINTDSDEEAETSILLASFAGRLTDADFAAFLF